jgi:hypothetical protein
MWTVLESVEESVEESHRERISGCQKKTIPGRTGE